MRVNNVFFNGLTTWSEFLPCISEKPEIVDAYHCVKGVRISLLPALTCGKRRHFTIFVGKNGSAAPISSSSILNITPNTHVIVLHAK